MAEEFPQGLCLLGRWGGVEQVRCGPNHPTTPNQPVENMFKATVVTDRPDGSSVNLTATFNWLDRETGEDLAMARSIERSGLVEGQPCALRVRVTKTRKVGDQTYADYSALRLMALPGATGSHLHEVA